MFAGQFAQAAIDFRQGRRDEAMATVERALDGWLKFQAQRIPARHSGVDADVVAIRQLLFRPLGDLDLFKDGWNAFSFPATLPRYLMVPADLVIVLPGEAAATRTVWQTFPDFPNTLFIEGADHARLSRVLDVVGGTARREPRQIMETPNQPIGVARDLATAWNALFPTRPGHWGGWELTAYPRITRITFVDADRTQALAAVTIGYSGATVVLEKVDGRWVARRLIDRWVT